MYSLHATCSTHVTHSYFLVQGTATVGHFVSLCNTLQCRAHVAQPSCNMCLCLPCTTESLCDIFVSPCDAQPWCNMLLPCATHSPHVTPCFLVQHKTPVQCTLVFPMQLMARVQHILTSTCNTQPWSNTLLFPCGTCCPFNMLSFPRAMYSSLCDTVLFSCAMHNTSVTHSCLPVNPQLL